MAESTEAVALRRSQGEEFPNSFESKLSLEDQQKMQKLRSGYEEIPTELLGEDAMDLDRHLLPPVSETIQESKAKGDLAGKALEVMREQGVSNAPERQQQRERGKGKDHIDIHHAPHKATNTPSQSRPTNPPHRASRQQPEAIAQPTGVRQEEKRLTPEAKVDRSMEEMSVTEIARIIERAAHIVEEATKILNKKLELEYGSTRVHSADAEHPSEKLETPVESAAEVPETQEPNNFNLTWSEYVKRRDAIRSQHPADETHIVRTPHGFVDTQPKAGNPKLHPFASERAYKEQFIGPNDKVEDYDYHVTKQSTSYYDKLGGIDNQDKAYEAPDYSSMTITELVREAGKAKYINPGNESEDIVDADLKAIRDAARTEYMRKARESGDTLADATVTKNMELFENMVDRYVNLRLVEDIDKTEAGKDTLKAYFKRWWAGMQHRFGVHHWDKGWGDTSDTKDAALNSGVSETMSIEEREKKKSENRYSILLGRASLLAQHFKRKEPQERPKKGLGTAQAWRVHAAALAREFPKDFKYDKFGELQRVREDGSLSEAAQKRYQEITELQYKR